MHMLGRRAAHGGGGQNSFGVNGGSLFCTPDSYDISGLNDVNQNNFDVFGNQHRESNNDKPRLYCHMAHFSTLSLCTIRARFESFKLQLTKCDKHAKIRIQKNLKKQQSQTKNNNNNNNNNNGNDTGNDTDKDIDMSINDNNSNNNSNSNDNSSDSKMDNNETDSKSNELLITVEESQNIVDDGYNMKALMTWFNGLENNSLIKPVLLTPLQIVCSQYIAPTTNQGTYSKMIPILVYYGADIHYASFMHLAPLDHEQEEKEDVIKELKHQENLVRKTGTVLNKYDSIDWSKRGVSLNDQKQRLNIIRTKENLQTKLRQSTFRVKQLKEQLSAINKRFAPIMVNASPYVCALKLRRSCNDNSIIEGIVEGANMLKELVFDSVENEDFDESLAQIVVEYMIGLPLNIWEA